jgi:PKD repeat protein
VFTNALGYLKASPQGNRLASADFSNSTFSLYDFDNATGIVSNADISPAIYSAPYGCEWSPDGTKLYGGGEGYNQLWQFDVSAPNVWNSATLIYETTSQEYEALQLGPDGKVYTSRYQTPWLGVVNDPNSAGLACNYVDDGVDLLGRYCYLGLPNYNMSIFNSQISAAFSSNDTILCEKFCVDFFDASSNNPVSWLWSFAGASPSSSTAQNPTNICYDSAGVFNVTLVATTANGISDSVTLSNYITVYTNPLAPVIIQNGNTLMSSAATTYQWQLNLVDIPGATNQSYDITQSGLYTVITGNEHGCTSQSSINAFIVGISEVDETLSVNIFPNPSNGAFNVEISSGSNANIQFRVINAIGQRVIEQSENMNSLHFTTSIDLRNLAGGIYFLEVKADEVVMQFKLIRY